MGLILIRRKLLSIGHSYVVDVNRVLPNELQKQSKGAWEVTVVAPKHFRGKNDIRPLDLKLSKNDCCQVEALEAHLTNHIHFFRYERRLRSLLQGDFDLIHAWEEPYLCVGMQIAFNTPTKTPLVFRSAQSLNKKYIVPFNWIERYCVNRMSGWIFSGKLVEENLLTRPGYSGKPRCHAPLGYDPSAMHVDKPAGQAIRRTLGWDNSIPVIGYLGRFVAEKGISVLMSALDNLHSSWRLLMVGNGPMLGKLRKWSKKYPDRVAICSKVKHHEVAPYINAMDMMVAPSLTFPNWREQFGRMIVEAFACGVPIIGSDSGEIPNVIGDSGMVVPENNSKILANAIEQLIDSPGLRSEFTKSGLAVANEKYTWSKIATHTLKFFDQIIHSKASQ